MLVYDIVQYAESLLANSQACYAKSSAESKIPLEAQHNFFDGLQAVHHDIGFQLCALAVSWHIRHRHQCLIVLLIKGCLDLELVERPAKSLRDCQSATNQYAGPTQQQRTCSLLSTLGACARRQLPRGSAQAGAATLHAPSLPRPAKSRKQRAIRLAAGIKPEA